MKAKLYRQNLTQKHTHTHSQKRKRGKMNIYPAPKFGMIHCLFRNSADAGTSSCLWSFNPLLLRLLGEISPPLLCSHSSRGFSFGFGPTSACRSPEGVCSPPRQDGVKGAAASGALAHSGRGREGYGGGGASLRRPRPA